MQNDRSNRYNRLVEILVWNILVLFLDLFDRVPPLVTDLFSWESTSAEATGSKDEIQIFTFDRKLHTQ